MGAVWIKILSNLPCQQVKAPCFSGEQPSVELLSALFKLPITWAQLAFDVQARRVQVQGSLWPD